MPPSAGVSERNRSIDIARMVAAGLIVAYHAGIYQTAVYVTAGSYLQSGGPLLFGYAPSEIVGAISLWGRVPFFFFLSGYFAARTLGKGTVSWQDFIRKRFELLAVPFLFWNLISLGMLYYAARHGADLLTNWTFTPKTIFMQLTGIGMIPADIPLWFVRDLLIATCVAPLMFRSGRWLLLPCIAMIIFEKVPPEGPRVAWPLISSIGYFGVGMLLNRIPPGTFQKFFPRPGLGLLFALGIGVAFMATRLPIPPLIGPAIGAAQILLAGCFINAACPRIAEWLGSRANSSFIIFAGNVPFFAIARQIFLRLPQRIPPGTFFAISAVLFYFLAILLHDVARKHCPSLLRVMSGGR